MNVILFPARAVKAADASGVPTVEPLLVTQKSDSPYCGCHTMVFHEQNRTVACGKCSRAFEAFDALVRLAEDWATYSRNRTAMRREIESLQAKRDRLERDVTNLKAQLRRLEPK